MGQVANVPLRPFMGMTGSIIGSTSHTYGALLAARIVQGFVICAYEPLNYAIIGDIVFVQERGLYVSNMNFTFTYVSNLSSVVAGPIMNTLGFCWLSQCGVLTIGI